MSVSSYFGTLHSLWQELEKHEPIISCNFCSDCVASQLHETRRNYFRLHDFLMGLYSEFYGSLRTYILSLDPPPSLDRAYHLAVQEERVRSSANTDSVTYEAVGFAVRSCSSQKRRSGSASFDLPRSYSTSYGSGRNVVCGKCN